MESVLVKIFATALALSQVTIEPQAVKTHFDRVQDGEQVVQLLRDGCAHMKQAFDIESINIDDLIATAMNDPKSMGSQMSGQMGGQIDVLHGLNIADLNTAHRQFCNNEPIATPVVDIGEVIDFFNAAAADLPDPNALKGRKLPSLSTVLDGGGEKFADVFVPGNRRIWVSLDAVPELVQKAFIAAEDRRFYEHHGVDERGLIRAFIGNLAHPGRPQGGSTITQQLVKNLLVGDDVSYERKIREMIVAAQLEATLSKNEILELYLNTAYLGRGAWGIEMAARSYFGKPARALSLAQGAMLASLLKGPNFYNPDRHPARARERLTYVLDRMQEDNDIGAAQKNDAMASPPVPIAYVRPRRDSGFHFVDFLGREAKADGVSDLTAQPYTVRSTINAKLQRAAEAALQEGLARYEQSNGRLQFRGPEANLGDAVQKLAATGNTSTPAWQRALQAVRLPLYDVHWTPAVVVQKGDETLRIGLPDGRVVPLSGATSSTRRSLGLYDVVYVHVVESRSSAGGKGSAGTQAQLRMRPRVQGAALVLQNRTGRILAMVGGFSYPLSQLNRAAQTARQPGSAMKPLTYLTALQRGLQPNTLVPNDPITLPPIHGKRREDYWSPRNADHSEGGMVSMRHGLEHSVNLVTAHLLDGFIDDKPAASLDAVCATAVAAKIYPSCVRYYPFILGAQPVRMIDLAGFYAAVANEGLLPRPHGIDTIELNGNVVYKYPEAPLPRVAAADAVSFYQLKTMLQGVVARGTARSIGELSPYVAGKTGTTEDGVDGWFIGFTNDVTIAVWVGYDNGDGKRRSLGGSATGAQVALPIFEPILQAVWANRIAPKVALSGPSPETRRKIVDVAVDYDSGTRGRRGELVEHLRAGWDKTAEKKSRAADNEARARSRRSVEWTASPQWSGYERGGGNWNWSRGGGGWQQRW